MDNDILIIGIGNYGRSDDALGWKFIDYVSIFADKFDLEYRYQLQIEDAELIRKYSSVIFVDASRENLPNGFSFKKCSPMAIGQFTSHRLLPEQICWLASEIYDAHPSCWTMAISGYDWELNHGLSEKASQNFEKALNYFNQLFDHQEKDLNAETLFRQERVSR